MPTSNIKKCPGNPRAFTLIELLIVIAIIGILATVVLVRLVDAKGKARDAAIMKSANIIMKLAQVSAAQSGSYAGWNNRGWFGTEDDCETRMNAVAFPYLSASEKTSVIAACKEIIKNIGDTGYSGVFSGTQKMIFYNYYNVDSASCPAYFARTGNCPKFSIVAALPYAKRFYCVGSNGGTSKELPFSGSGCGGSYACSGCLRDPNGGGN